MDLTSDQRFELLKLEMELIQGVFDKYDMVILQSRNWFVTIWMATLGLAFTVRIPAVMLLAAALAILYWLIEGSMRHHYWYRYLCRYRVLRNAVNRPGAQIETLALYDLTDHFNPSRPSRAESLRYAFGKTEPMVLYSVMGAAAVGLWWLVRVGALRLSPLVGGQ